MASNVAITFLKYGLPTSVLLWGERLALGNSGANLPILSGNTTIQVPKLYGLVVLTNVVGSFFTLIYLSVKVGQARKKYDVNLPIMYSTEKNEAATKFNCIQRGHQQALETYTPYVALSLIGGLMHPITTAGFGLMYMVSRVKWAEGYAQDPASRYTHSTWGKHVWSSLIGVVVTSVSTSLFLMGVF